MIFGWRRSGAAYTRPGRGGFRRCRNGRAARFGRRLVQCLAVAFILFGGIVPCALADGEAQGEAQSELFINGWQGAKNYSESFSITLGGGSTNGAIRFLCGNCSVSPSTGTINDTYTVTVKGAGTYSLTAIMAGDGKYAEVSDSKRGAGGKSDQAPLYIEGWGCAKGYYRTFAIRVSGGTLGNTVSFETDGCSVSPESGPPNSQFTVTVTRVGAYSLTAVMDGDQNHNKAYSARQSGVACKSNQSAINISGWDSSACFGDVFPVQISGGLSSEALSIDSVGCSVTHVSGCEYEVSIDTVGPYSVTASRAGNYGYNAANAYVSGISTQANQPSISVSGWSDSKNVGDSFSIQIRGGASDGTVHFATSGCTVSPLTGTADTNFFVTIGTVGTYTLIAYVDGTDHYNGASSREFKGVAGKSPQPVIGADHWDDNAATGSSFDVRLTGGMGTGATSVTTYGGCSAVLKNPDEGNVYTVTVTAAPGESYGLSISKLGDANYLAAAEATLEGVAVQTGKASAPLSVNGWKDNTQADESFAIHLEGGDPDLAVSFETVGCIVEPSSGTVGDIYTVTVTAEAGETYSLSIGGGTSGGGNHSSVLKSGNVRPTIRVTEEDALPLEKETPMLGSYYDVWLLLGMVVTLLILLSLAVLLQYRQRRYRRRYRR